MQQTGLLMICTGTGSAPMRAFTMARQRTVGALELKLSIAHQYIVGII